MGKNMKKDLKYLQMVIFISEGTNLIVQRGMDSIIGKTALFIVVSFYQECATEEEYGKCLMETPMKVNI